MPLIRGRLVGSCLSKPSSIRLFGRFGPLQPCYSRHAIAFRSLSQTASRSHSHPKLNLHAIDLKWRQKWTELRSNPAVRESDAPSESKYVLPMFPYPSGNLHLGHLRVYTIADVVARFHTLQGSKAILPMGWDAFGLPAENAAIERGINPATWTRDNIAKMKEQLELMNGSWDWSRVCCMPKSVFLLRELATDRNCIGACHLRPGLL
jgi:leucyl-tRNA synthetase